MSTHKHTHLVARTEANRRPCNHHHHHEWHASHSHLRGGPSWMKARSLVKYWILPSDRRAASSQRARACRARRDFGALPPGVSDTEFTPCFARRQSSAIGMSGFPLTHWARRHQVTCLTVRGGKSTDMLYSSSKRMDSFVIIMRKKIPSLLQIVFLSTEPTLRSSKVPRKHLALLYLPAQQQG